MSLSVPKIVTCWIQCWILQRDCHANILIRSYASLQSVVWHVFCRKVDCTMADSWNVAREMVETRMSGYKMETVDGA